MLFHDMWNKIKEAWNRQPDITIEVIKPMPNVKPQEFELKGKILQTSYQKRTISKGGSSSHVTIPPEMIPFLRDFNYVGRFEAYGKEGLIMMCEGAEP